MKSLIATGLCALAAGLTLAPSRPTDAPPRLPQPPAHDLTQEVYALRLLYYFRLNSDQFAAIQKLAAKTACPARKRTPAKASDDYRALLAELRDALVAADDPERIEDLENKVYDLQESETPALDDSFDITAEACKAVPAVFRLFKPAQLASYYALMADDLSDPTDALIAALESVRELEDDEFPSRRDELAAEIGWLTAGLDATRNTKVTDGVVELLDAVRPLSEEDFKTQLPKLERRARKLIGDVDPADALRHHVQHVLADLLSNPRLAAVLEARLKPEQ